ncbi:MAG: HD domain-containing protein [Deltaproteobacteria bacterium]|nr:HD domain-containing protein [Deltaproteobacteria bacterium]
MIAMENVSIFLMAVGVLLVVIAIVSFFLSARENPKPVIDVSLPELASVWLKYNDEVTAINDIPEGVESLYKNRCDTGPVKGKNAGVNSSEKEPAEKASQPQASTPAQVMVSPPASTPAPSVPAAATIKAPPLSEGAITGLIERLKPYENIFAAQRADGLLKALIHEIDRFGHCSSLVTKSKDSEAVELYSVRDNLSRVSLKEHTVGVVNRILGLLEKTYADFENHIPRAVIAALAHDLGKIPEYWASGAYNTHEHPFVSASRLKELIGDAQISWLDDVIKAVKDHHIPTTNQFTALLKEADRSAREFELLKFAGALSVMPMEKWLDPVRLVKFLQPNINVLKDGRWQAFSFGGLVYCNPGFLYEQAKLLCRDAKALDLVVIYESEKEVALRRMTGILRQAGYIPDMLRQNYYARKFEIVAAAGKKRFVLIPLKGEHFNLQELEARKIGYLSSIRGVKYL